jgi:hypothetical protein
MAKSGHWLAQAWLASSHEPAENPPPLQGRNLALCLRLPQMTGGHSKICYTFARAAAMSLAFSCGVISHFYSL